MHPAYSVILFTTASGAGYGLLIAMALCALLDGLPTHRWFGLTTFIVALGLITVGLLSSTFHLGHPERAWRAFSQWRTSWLSREGILAVATFAPALAFAWGWVVEEEITDIWRIAAALTVSLSGLTVYCTAMIYASLRPVRAWYNPYTVICYLAFAVWTGALWFNFLAHAFGLHGPGVALFIAIVGPIIWFFKRRYWIFIDSSPAWVPVENATGLGHLGKVRLLDGPSTQESYIQKEMGYQIARKHATQLRIIAFFAYFPVPMLAALITMESPAAIAIPGALIAVLSGMTGTVIERWLFFAEARHTAALYYGAVES